MKAKEQQFFQIFFFLTVMFFSGDICVAAFSESTEPPFILEAKDVLPQNLLKGSNYIVDGNKRSGAFLLIDFLHRNNSLHNRHGEPIINDTGLAALTLLVAESDPMQKESLIRLIMHMLNQPDR